MAVSMSTTASLRLIRTFVLYKHSIAQMFYESKCSIRSGTPSPSLREPCLTTLPRYATPRAPRARRGLLADGVSYRVGNCRSNRLTI